MEHRMELPTERLKKFFNNVISDTSTENIIEQLEPLAEDEINSIRDFLQHIDMLTYDRMIVIDNELKKEFEEDRRGLGFASPDPRRKRFHVIAGNYVSEIPALKSQCVTRLSDW